jgi:chromosome segregation ATPase
MGILDRFRRKKQPEKPAEETTPTEVHIDEVHDWVNQTLAGKIRDKHERANELYSDVMKGFGKIKESADILEQAAFTSDEKLGAVVNMTKDLFVKRVHTLVNNMQGFQGRHIDLKVLSDFQASAADALADMSSITPKQAYLLSTYFSKESSGVIDNIKDTQERLSVLKEFLEAEGETIQLAHSIKTKKEQQSLLRLRLNTVEKEESGIELRIKELRNKTEKNLAEIEGILKGHEYAEYNQILEAIEKNRRRSASIKERITEEFLSVQRPLKKLEYLVSKNYSILKEQETVLDGVINRSFETFEKNEESTIRDVLLLVRKANVEEKMSLKSSELEKMDEVVSRLDTNLKDLKTEYQELEDGLRDLERDKNRYEWVIERKTHLENNIKHALEEIASLEKVLDTSAQDKEGIRKEMERQKKELEDILFKTSGKKVSIVVPEESKPEEKAEASTKPEANS